MGSNQAPATLCRPRVVRRGFTLVELLVVMAIIAVLIGMLMPAINAAREMARRSTCSTNMHNVVVAVGNYASNAGGDALPIGIDPVNRTSGLTYLLPFMEAGIVTKTYNFSATADSQTGITIKRIPVLVCPSDNQSGFFTSAGSGTYAQSNMVRCFGSATLNPTVSTNAGAFKVGSASSFAAMTDGTSNTAMGSEAISEKDATTSTKFDGAWGYGEAGATAFTTSALPNPTGTGVGTLTSTTVSSAATLAGYATANAAASSRHTGGVNVFYGDFHVSFVSNNIDSTIWAAQGTAAGGEANTFQSANQ